MLRNAKVYLRRQQLNEAAERLDKSKIIALLELFRNSTDWQHNYQGETVLHMTVKGGRNDASKVNKEDRVIKILELFLQRQMNVNTENSAGFTALQIAILHKMTRVVEFLLRHGAHLNDIDECKYSLARLIIQNGHHENSYCDRTNWCFMEWLLLDNFYYYTSTKNKDENTNYHLTIKLNMVQLLPIISKYPEQLTGRENTVLHTFIDSMKNADYNCGLKVYLTKEYDYEETCEVIILKKMMAQGMSVDAVDQNGNTVLHIAARKWRPEIIEILLQNFKDVNIKNISGATVMHMLIEHCINFQTMSHKRDIEKFVEILAQKGADVNSDSYEYNPVELAVMRGHLPVLKLLRKYGANFNVAKCPDRNLLHLIGKESKEMKVDVRYNEIIDLLLNQGCDINATDESGKTPLHVAIKSGCIPITLGLLRHGACLNLPDKSNFTPLYYAMKQNDLQAVQELLKYGADINDKCIYRQVLDLPNNSSVLDTVLNHWMKMKAAGLPVLQCYESDFDLRTYEHLYTDYLAEVKALKNYNITDHISLYDFLHMDWNCRCSYVGHKKLREYVHSSDIEVQYPKYYVIILASYNDAVARKVLLEKAILS